METRNPSRPRFYNTIIAILVLTMSAGIFVEWLAVHDAQVRRETAEEIAAAYD